MKQLTETSDMDTTVINFDVHGNATQMQIKGGCNCLVKFEYKYDKNGKKNGVIEKNGEKQQVYKCDKNGRIIEQRVDTKAVEVRSGEQDSK